MCSRFKRTNSREIEVSHLVCAADLVPARGDESEPLSPAKSTRSRSPLSPGTGQEMESEDDRQATSRQMPKTTGRNIYGNIHVAGIRVPAREGVVGLWFLFTVSETRPRRAERSAEWRTHRAAETLSGPFAAMMAVTRARVSATHSGVLVADGSAMGLANLLERATGGGFYTGDSALVLLPLQFTLRPAPRPPTFLALQ